MITVAKLKAFIYYNYDINYWARSINMIKDDTLNTDDWYLIERIIQDISLLESGFVSDELKAKMCNYISTNTDSETTIKMLKDIAIKQNSKHKEQKISTKIINIIKIYLGKILN